jgi:hypothetical protein
MRDACLRSALGSSPGGDLPTVTHRIDMDLDGTPKANVALSLARIVNGINSSSLSIDVYTLPTAAPSFALVLRDTSASTREAQPW